MTTASTDTENDMSRRSQEPREPKYFTNTPQPRKHMDPAELLAELKLAHAKLGECIEQMEAK